MNSDIYSMELHEQFSWNDLAVLRVPGGWIYTYFDTVIGGIKTSTFVPFDNEFQIQAEDVK